MLDAFCMATGLNRKYAIGLLREPPEKLVRLRSPRKRKQRYGAEVIKVLETIWEAADFPWSVRLKAMIPLWLPYVGKRVNVTAKTEAALSTISPRTIDRKLVESWGQISTSLTPAGNFGWSSKKSPTRAA